MWRLAVFGLTLASATWATPVAFTGTSTVGGDTHNVFLNGTNSGFAFGNATPGWSIFFKSCDWETGPCDLSYQFFVQKSFADFIASDGMTTTGSNGFEGPNGGPPGLADGLLTWIVKPLTTPPVMIPGPGGPTATVLLPITLFGELKAWTPGELAANGAPFFDYQIAASGTLSAFFYGTIDNVMVANAEFSGTATPIPEPATWCSALALSALLLRRRCAALP